MTGPRRICVVTGSRAEYGLLYWLMKAIAEDPALELQVIATGMHLASEFGATHRQIEADGFCIDAKVEMLLASDTPVGVTKSIGLGVIGFADALERLKPHLLVVLGDRFEILAAAQAAMVGRIPIAHLHGGETTEGALDEGIRHAITKMARWHFVAAEPYRKRVIQLGEPVERVFAFGPPSLDVLRHLDWINRDGLETELGIRLASPVFLVTYHPETLGHRAPGIAFDDLLAALDRFPAATVVFTYPNADTGGREIMGRLTKWIDARGDRARLFVSLGQRRYLSLMREADVVIGNSSSGLTEAPALGTPTVNIGDRQKGRMRPGSVIDAADDRQSIVAAIETALAVGRHEFPSLDDGGTPVSVRIKDTLKVVALETRKTFFDVPHAF